MLRVFFEKKSRVQDFQNLKVFEKLELEFSVYLTIIITGDVLNTYLKTL